MQATKHTAKNAATEVYPVSKSPLWVGRVIGGAATLFLLFDAAIKVARLPAAVEASAQLGYSAPLTFGIGLLALACLALYVLPRTAVLGAIALTGYLGGAVATQVRAGSPAFSILVPVILGAMFWAGLALGNPRARGLVLQP